MSESGLIADQEPGARDTSGLLPEAAAETGTRPTGKQVPKGRIFNIQRFSTEDGPGIRTTVFLKGCSLTCLWCSNPESQQTWPELAHSDALCDHCGRCVPACTRKAISLADVGISVNRDLCDNCGECVLVCGPRALRMMGREHTVDEVFEEILKDRQYYRNSSGGVTCSGGEPLMQAPFVAALFERCQEAGINTTLDTCGYGPGAPLTKVLKHTDLVLFDIKVIDNDIHMRTTGVSNQSILENARRVAESNVPMIIRVPLIPEVSDSDENITAIAQFVKKLRPGLTVNVLPYHRFGMNKYKMLDQAYPMKDAQPIPQERVARIVELFESFDLTCEIIT